ncbi:hypothetical protein Verru16b_00910 [Lacunisphaera limnophila]|uniref:DUF5069 domain-containing protein n=1 Tax=Lacunisphaera limnophila TaxID=1838286 RepID=A0A1D8ASK7_9BACT|nr:DUF5069 domain-containing protein [Lacunisphaera limnophila]AOS43852.1 hypothetical protein Verru16b_00910 [Lacunisphaera limnophila]
MPRVAGLRSPYDKSVGGLHHLGRMLDKIRLMQSGALPEHYHRNYGLSIGLDGQLCGFLGVAFADVAAQVAAGRADGDVAEWIFTTGLRPNRMQTLVWNEHSRKIGWNDRVAAFNAKVKTEPGWEHLTAITSFDLIEQSEEREPPAMKA